MEVNMVKGLYGSTIAKTKCVGYCKRHGCYLTCHTLKQRECLGKQCHFLDKHEEHDYWRQRAQKKALKKASKMTGGMN
jgi:hypothetical protein